MCVSVREANQTENGKTNLNLKKYFSPLGSKTIVGVGLQIQEQQASRKKRQLESTHCQLPTLSGLTHDKLLTTRCGAPPPPAVAASF